MQKYKSKNGITLIALVITIIVLLILAGVSIVMLTGDNSILRQATTAKEQTETGQIRERINIAYHGALVNGQGELSQDNLERELTKEFGDNYTITPSADKKTWTIIVNGVSLTVTAGQEKKEELDKTEETTPWLPENTKEITNNDLKTGLTIKDSNDNEWVWIVVPKSKTASATSDTDIETALRAYVAEDNFIVVGTSSGSDKTTTKGHTDKWYAKDGNTLITENTANLTDEQKLLDNGCGLTYNEYRRHRSEMLQSIKEHGGFYIGKYETGYELLGETAVRANKTDPIDTTKYKPVIKKDSYPYNYVTCSQAEILSEGLNPNPSGDTITSLMFGIQWDLVLRCLKENSDLTVADLTSDSSKWGNYNTNTSRNNPSTALTITSENAQKATSSPYSSFSEITGTKDNIRALLTTGASDTASRLNVYDIAGNLLEWTLEKSSNLSNPCTWRGGYYGSDGQIRPASDRVGNNTTDSSDNYGFRVSLY